MSQIISIATPIDNSGKTTTAVNLATSLALIEKKTLLVDCDPKQNSSYGTSVITSASISEGLISVIKDETPLSEAIEDSRLEHLKILPLGTDFSKEKTGLNKLESDLMALHHLIETIADDFDYIVMDVPSDLGNISRCTLLASDWLIIPLNSGFKTETILTELLIDLKSLLSVIIELKEQFKRHPKIAGILINRCDQKADISEKLPKDVQDYLNRFFLDTTIPDNGDLADAQAFGKPIALNNIMSTSAQAYLDLACEMVDKIN